jgi:hypothetical protein
MRIGLHNSQPAGSEGHTACAAMLQPIVKVQFANVIQSLSSAGSRLGVLIIVGVVSIILLHSG